MDCDHCDDYERCSGTPCPYHFLVIGAVKNLMEALEEGGLWGDMAYAEDAAELAAETPAQLSARLQKQEAAEEAGAQALKQYELQKRKNINIDPKTGKPVNCSGIACRDAEEPAKWVLKGELLFDAYGEKVLDNKGRHKHAPSKEWAATDPKAKSKPTKRPEGVPASAVFWSYGCEYLAKGKCEHLHPGQPGYEAAKAVADAKKAGKKPNVEALLAKACFLSSKTPTTARSSPATASTAQSSPQLIDSWN